jgi:hypothetical protein
MLLRIFAFIIHFVANLVTLHFLLEKESDKEKVLLLLTCNMGKLHTL